MCVSSGRVRRASVASWESRLEEVSAGLAKLRRDNEKKRSRLQTLRETLASRRRTLSAARLRIQPGPGGIANSKDANVTEVQDLAALSHSLARARSGLVQELVEVFNVVEVGGRPPVGGRGGTKGEWTIGDLILPVPGDIRRYPPDHINAVITHSVHFLSLLTFYLGIKLPFEIVWTGGKLGVGMPLIGAIPGGEAGGWARWHTKHPLHISEPLPTAGTSARPSSMSSSRILSSVSPTESFVEEDSSPLASFTTALAMLLYDVSYLAHTQSVDIPLAQAGDVLSNLWGVCCSPELGRKSHETHPYLPPPTPLSFPLDFGHLLQATTANPARPRKSSSSSKPRRSSGAGRREKKETIVEEDGWDLVDDHLA